MGPDHIRRSLLLGSAILAGGLVVLASRVFAGDAPLIIQPPPMGQVEIDPPPRNAASAPQIIIPPPQIKPAQTKPTQTKPTRVRMSAADCRRAVAYQPAPDVEYRPGVDVRGRKVAPADLSGQDQTTARIRLPDIIAFDVKIDFAKYMGAVVTPGYDLEGSAGLVEFDLRTGKMTFNGQPLDNDTSLEVQAQCRRVLSGR
jgi:hypothetical protein